MEPAWFASYKAALMFSSLWRPRYRTFAMALMGGLKGLGWKP